MARSKNNPIVFHSYRLINKKAKTVTFFWQEDFVAFNEATQKGNCNVTSKIKQETYSFDINADPEGLKNMLADCLSDLRSAKRSNKPLRYKIV